VKQQYHFVRHFSEWIAAVYANCPHQEVQQFLLENVAEEEGLIGSGDFKPVRHTELLIEFAEICGMSRAEILAAETKGELLPELLGLRSWCTVQSRRAFIAMSRRSLKLQSASAFQTESRIASSWLCRSTPEAWAGKVGE